MSSTAFVRQVFAWLHQVNGDDKLPGSAVKVAVYLSSMFNEEEEDGVAWPSCKTIAAAIRKSEATVIDCVRHLEERGHLRVAWGKQGRGCSNRYWMITKPQEAKVSEHRKPQEAKVSAARKTSVSDSENLSFHPGKPQPAKETLSKDSSKEPSSSSNGAGIVEGKQHPYGRLLAQLLKAAGDNVERDKWGIAYGIDSVEPILMLRDHDRCSLEQDILPAITELVPTLTEPLKTWNDSRIRDACIARRRTREAEARAKEKA
jgi:hypothetical protein